MRCADSSDVHDRPVGTECIDRRLLRQDLKDLQAIRHRKGRARRDGCPSEHRPRCLRYTALVNRQQQDRCLIARHAEALADRLRDHAVRDGVKQRHAELIRPRRQHTRTCSGHIGSFGYAHRRHRNKICTEILRGSWRNTQYGHALVLGLGKKLAILVDHTFELGLDHIRRAVHDRHHGNVRTFRPIRQIWIGARRKVQIDLELCTELHGADA